MMGNKRMKIAMAARVVSILVGWLGQFWLASLAQSEDLTITASFKPSILAPQRNQFVNTTAASGFCADYPSECAGKAFSIKFPVVWSYGAMKAKETNPRQAAYAKVPSTFRNVAMVNTATGLRTMLRFRVSGFAMGYILTKSAAEIVGMPSDKWLEAHGVLWGGTNWARPPSPCTKLTVFGYVSQAWMKSIWGYPEGADACVKLPAYAIDGLQMWNAGLMYELETPDPMMLDNGKYTGSLSYSIGKNQDFDFGDNATVNASSQKINFELTVEHELKVNYPESSHRVLLEPPGGWQVWQQQGRPATGLLREVPFSLASSGNFSVRLECQYNMATHCGIANSKMTVFPVVTKISIEGVKVKASGINAEDVRLGADLAVAFSSRFNSAARRSKLSFSMSAADASMMARQAGDAYLGIVTVVFDANVI